jgi:hypothetical protein
MYNLFKFINNTLIVLRVIGPIVVRSFELVIASTLTIRTTMHG